MTTGLNCDLTLLPHVSRVYKTFNVKVQVFIRMNHFYFMVVQSIHNIFC